MLADPFKCVLCPADPYLPAAELLELQCKCGARYVRADPLEQWIVVGARPPEKPEDVSIMAPELTRGVRQFVGVPLPLVGDMLHTLAPGDSYIVRGQPQVDMVLSRLRWSAHPGLLLLDLKIGHCSLNVSWGAMISMHEPGLWRFPPWGVAAGYQASVLLYNRGAVPVQLEEITLWGKAQAVQDEHR